MDDVNAVNDPTTHGPGLIGRVGILGGTFDPPHIGHLWLAAEARRILDLATVLLMVAGDPWQKRDRRVSPASVRFEMVRCAVSEIEGLEASDLEMRSDGATYTVETLERLRVLEPLCEPVLILGTDSAANIGSWHRFDDLDDLCELVVADRPGADPARSVPLPFRSIEIGALPVSSTMVRNRVREGAPVDVLCPPCVVSSIQGLGLYRDD